MRRRCDTDASMDPATTVVIAIGILAVTVFGWKTLQKAIEKTAIGALQGGLDQAGKMIEEAKVTLKGLESERMRALAAQRWKGKGAAPDDDTQEIEIPDWVYAVAKGAGISPEKVLAGDPSEVAKVQQLLGKAGGKSAPADAEEVYL